MRRAALLAAGCIVSACVAACGGGDRATWRLDELHANAPLVGRHLVLRCDDCHGTAAYNKVASTCDACHHAAFVNSSFDHSAFGISLDCGGCHTPEGWSPAHFDHDKFGFPLTGKHTAVACDSCHIGSVWPGQPTACDSCHWGRRQDDVWRLALGRQCGDCHTTQGWNGAAFDHLARTGFALTGAHSKIACVDCHPDHNPAGAATECNACHAPAAVTARHPAFATDCASCHTTAAWTPSTMNHESSFPIASGAHSRFGCTDCHQGATFADFTCVTCHTEAATTPRHSEVSGYTFDSAACYRCHPRGSGGD